MRNHHLQVEQEWTWLSHTVVFRWGRPKEFSHYNVGGAALLTLVRSWAAYMQCGVYIYRVHALLTPKFAGLIRDVAASDMATVLSVKQGIRAYQVIMFGFFVSGTSNQSLPWKSQVVMFCPPYSVTALWLCCTFQRVHQLWSARMIHFAKQHFWGCNYLPSPENSIVLRKTMSCLVVTSSSSSSSFAWINQWSAWGQTWAFVLSIIPSWHMMLARVGQFARRSDQLVCFWTNVPAPYTLLSAVSTQLCYIITTFMSSGWYASVTVW